eukprot:407078-Pleurochrysis_carterae.AAC.2
MPASLFVLQPANRPGAASSTANAYWMARCLGSRLHALCALAPPTATRAWLDIPTRRLPRGACSGAVCARTHAVIRAVTVVCRAVVSGAHARVCVCASSDVAVLTCVSLYAGAQ